MTRSGEEPVAPPMSRRRALGLLGAFAVVGLAACADGGGGGASGTRTPSSNPSTTSPSTTTPSGAGAEPAVAAIPEETAGPYPGDGSNGPDVLREDGVVRTDIRSSFGGADATAAGVPTTIALKVVDPANGGSVVPGVGVYVWHCDREGRYSMYTQGAADQNYLRGVQATGADGVARFTSIFPACYSGRWPHVHFEVYPSVTSATSGGTPLATSQIALPKATCDAVYATTGYAQSVRTLSQVSLQGDMVFGDDGGVHELATVTGDTGSGYVVALTVGVDGASRI